MKNGILHVNTKLNIFVMMKITKIIFVSDKICVKNVPETVQ